MDFGTLLSQGQGAALAYLPVAFALGALHALEPGHAKTMMAGFIAATHGTAAQAALLGLAAAVAHSLIVWALAALGLWLGELLIAERALPWLQAGGGLAVLAIAAWMAHRLRREEGAGHHHHHHGHHHHHDHNHAHDHHHAMPGVTTRQIVAVGFSGGLVPCPSAVPVLILALQSGAVAVGAATVAAFSFGLAAVLVGIGVAAAFGIARLDGAGRWMRSLPWLSVAVITLAGLYALAKGLANLAV